MLVSLSKPLVQSFIGSVFDQRATDGLAAAIESGYRQVRVLGFSNCAFTLIVGLDI
jgi:hypothetical protein